MELNVNAPTKVLHLINLLIAGRAHQLTTASRLEMTWVKKESKSSNNMCLIWLNMFRIWA